MKPVIGISSQYDHEPDRYSIITEYISFLESLGALAILMPPFSSLENSLSLLEICDGLVIPGGDDISPESYQQAPFSSQESSLPLGDSPLSSEATAFNPARDKLEIALIRRAIQVDMPFLGICRGMQIANVALGGTLFSDLPKAHLDTIDHLQEEPYEEVSHSATLREESLTNLMQKPTIMVNSMHHQGVHTLAPALKLMAQSDDGLVEAFCHPELSFFWGVQWHPEYLTEQKSSQVIGKSFVSACKQYALISSGRTSKE